MLVYMGVNSITTKKDWEKTTLIQEPILAARHAVTLVNPSPFLGFWHCMQGVS